MLELVERLRFPSSAESSPSCPPVWRRVRVYVHGQSATQRAWRRSGSSTFDGECDGMVSATASTAGPRWRAIPGSTVVQFRASDALAIHLALVADSLTRHGCLSQSWTPNRSDAAVIASRHRRPQA